MRQKNHYFQWGLTALCVISASLLLGFTLYNFRSLMKGVQMLTGILMPFIWGFVIAYLLLPIFNFNVRWMEPRVLARAKNKGKAKRKTRLAASILTVAEGILVVGGLLSLVVPQLVVSVYSLVELMQSMTVYSTELQQMINELLQSNPILESNFRQVYDEAVRLLTDFVSGFMLPQLVSMASGFMSTVSALKNFLIGIIIVIYVLCSKDLFCAQAKKIAYAALPVKKANLVIDNLRFTHRVFGGFISGKLLDSLIIGVISFVALTLFKFPYPMLISVIIGVTNIIPFFGPFIGAVPSALLVLMADFQQPIRCLYFILFILILQQFDGNILGPKILGDSTGLSAFWVMFAILVFGGVFGFVGMLVGVPLFAVFYALVSGLINRSLRTKHLSENTLDYFELASIDPLTLERKPIPQTVEPKESKDKKQPKKD
ncbi:MAG: AI-2E family transporter [Clostridiaceae bacterium]|nr:AI-2E family transporter [Clostridiaceae bacterium]